MQAEKAEFLSAAAPSASGRTLGTRYFQIWMDGTAVEFIR